MTVSYSVSKKERKKNANFRRSGTLMKILVLCVINSSRHRKCFVCGCIHSLFVLKAFTRSYLARSGF